MPIYQYVGRTHEGSLSRGNISAEGLADAFRLLKQRGIIPLRLQEAGQRASLFSNKMPLFRRRLKPVHVQYFCRQMATMLSAGLQITRALEVVANQKQNPRLSEIARGLQREIEQGKPLHTALAVYRKEFGPMLVNLLAAGEESGNVDQIFSHYADYLEKRIKLASEIKGAMIYPSLLFIIGTAVIGLLTFYVLPRFAQILDTDKFEMPAMTRMMLAVSDFLRQNASEAALAGGMMLLAATVLYRRPRVQWWIDRLKFSLPVIGGLTTLAVTARMSRSLAMMLKSGLPFLKNLELTIPVLGNRYAATLMTNIKMELASGVDLHTTFSKIRFLPSLFLGLVEVGEKSGKLDRMFEEAADYYEAELEKRLKRAVQLLEPVMLLVISLFVGVVSTALISTIMRAVQSLY